MDAAVAALAGAAIGSTIGAAGVIGAAWFQQRQQTRRELTKTAADLAIVDYGHKMADLRTKGGSMPPISTFVAYHADVLRAVAEGRLGPKDMHDIEGRQKALVTAVYELDRARHAD